MGYDCLGLLLCVIGLINVASGIYHHDLRWLRVGVSRGREPQSEGAERLLRYLYVITGAAALTLGLIFTAYASRPG